MVVCRSSSLVCVLVFKACGACPSGSMASIIGLCSCTTLWGDELGLLSGWGLTMGYYVVHHMGLSLSPSQWAARWLPYSHIVLSGICVVAVLQLRCTCIIAHIVHSGFLETLNMDQMTCFSCGTALWSPQSGESFWVAG